VSAEDGAPAARAERLLFDVLGERQFQRLRKVGYLDLPSQQFPGRLYRLDLVGNLSYRDAGETGFNTTLCVQPIETVPRDDMVAARYLLVTADEDRLLRTANPITFGFVSLARALYHDFRQRHPAILAGLLTTVILLFFLLSLAAEIWTVSVLLPNEPIGGVVLAIVLAAPALIGLVLLFAALVEAGRTANTWRARRRLAVEPA
jgi:hypothetical protein